MIFVFALIIAGIVTGLFCIMTGDGDPDNYAYEYELKPDCFTKSKRRGSCDGAKSICDFVSNDCATCEYWRGKC